MPIKFRCTQCRQFLGISRGMAEKLVDCPSCGRTIRVPTLEGYVAPVPQPKLDLEDSSLVDALDRLASIGNESMPGLVLASEDFPSDESGEESDEPVALRPPKPVPIAAAEHSVEPVAIEVEPTTSTSAVPPSELARPRAPARHEYDPLASLASEPADTRRERRFESNVLLMVLAGLVFVGLGALGGWYLAPRTPIVVSMTGRAEEDSDERSPIVPPSPERRSAIAGRVHYRTEVGDNPDRGAIVIAFPEERAGTLQLSVVGFRPGDAIEDFHVAKASLQALGGDAAVVAETGDFALDLPDAGHFRLLVISRYQARDDDGALPSELDDLLGRFFERPLQLIGERRYEFARVRWPGTDVISWSHAFPSTNGG